MIPVTENPKEALIQSYSKPIGYKDVILFKGKVIVRWKTPLKQAKKVVKNNVYNIKQNRNFNAVKNVIL